MTSIPAIEVQNLAKQYRIRHLGTGRKFRYGTLAETLSDSAANLGRRLSGKAVVKPLRWERFDALADLNFEVEQGEVLGLVGKNGAGKSTLLKILSRITEPTSGRIVLNGRVASLLEVGTGFHPELTGRENIYLNGAILGMTRREITKRFDEIVDFSGVERFLDTPVKRYSSGMYVRLAFAVAAHLEPEILLVDEVLAVGDAAFQRKCLGKMGDVATSEGRTIIFVSHNMPAVQRLCNKGIVLDDGRLTYYGDANEAVRQYLASGTSTGTQGFDLLAGRHEDTLAPAALSKCVLLGADSQPTTELRLGEPFSVYVEIRAKSNYPDLHLGVGIDTANQIRVTTVRNMDADFRLELKQDQSKGFLIHFDTLTLSPGCYSLLAFVADGPRVLDRARQAVTFEVSELQYSDAHACSLTSGVIQAWPRWETPGELLYQEEVRTGAA